MSNITPIGIRNRTARIARSFLPNSTCRWTDWTLFMITLLFTDRVRRLKRKGFTSVTWWRHWKFLIFNPGQTSASGAGLQAPIGSKFPTSVKSTSGTNKKGDGQKYVLDPIANLTKRFPRWPFYPPLIQSDLLYLPNGAQLVPKSYSVDIPFNDLFVNISLEVTYPHICQIL
jgi:hypothetical protein